MLMRVRREMLVGLVLALTAVLGCDDHPPESAASSRVEPVGSPDRAENDEAGVAGDSGLSGAVVLMYHRFGRDEYPSTSIRMDQFRDHVSYLQEEGFEILPLETVVDHLRSGEPFPEQAVAITIDDAYPSIYENAFPILRELGWPYTVFVNTDGPDGGGRSYLSWDQMREMAEESDVTFANHSASHDYLVERRDGESEKEWASRVREDIAKGERRLREEVGAHVPDEPKLHAYPYGEYDPALQAILEEMGYVAFGQHSGPVSRHSDLLGLPRFAMAEAYGDPEDFRQRINTRPFPIARMEPNDPTAVDEENPPVLELTFADGDIPLDRINCFAEGRKARVEWTGDSQRTLSVRADSPLGEGRSRYNCTAPAATGSYYWFSFQWLKGRR